jgi:dTDP-4-dehydrorhamnose 3,5-epimerase
VIFTAVDGISGAWVVDPEVVEDDRGSFARAYDVTAWSQHGIDVAIDHVGVSRNVRAGTLRGLHLQSAPHGEAKTVRCTRGRLFDVMVDVRPGSASYGHWAGFVLDAATHRSLHLPVGVAHGFVTLVPDTEVTYLISAPFVAEAAGGFRWDDPDVAIDWPVEPSVLSLRDRHLPTLADWAAAQEIP